MTTRLIIGCALMFIFGAAAIILRLKLNNYRTGPLLPFISSIVGIIVATPLVAYPEVGIYLAVSCLLGGTLSHFALRYRITPWINHNAEIIKRIRSRRRVIKIGLEGDTHE